MRVFTGVRTRARARHATIDAAIEAREQAPSLGIRADHAHETARPPRAATLLAALPAPPPTISVVALQNQHRRFPETRATSPMNSSAMMSPMTRTRRLENRR
jgi:hypothetical protein